MTEPTVFTSATTDPVTPPVVIPPTTTTLPPEVAELVGTGKKYATAEAALASIPHAQQHIVNLETETAKLRDELAKRRTTEELLEEIKQSGIPNGTTPPQGITADTVAQLVTKTLTERDAQQHAQTNINVVTSTFTEKFAEKAEEMYIKVAKESGLSVANLNQLAATSPTVVLKLAGIESKPTTTSVVKPTSSVNTESFAKPPDSSTLSSRIGKDGSTKNLVTAWRNAGVKIGKPT